MDVSKIARAFVAGAFEGLRKEFVIPTPIFHPYVQVGRDFFGLEDLAERRLEVRLTWMHGYAASASRSSSA